MSRMAADKYERADTSHPRVFAKSAVLKASTVPFVTLRENIQTFLNQIKLIVDAAPADMGGLVIDEIELHAQIDAAGNVAPAGE